MEDEARKIEEAMREQGSKPSRDGTQWILVDAACAVATRLVEEARAEMADLGTHLAHCNFGEYESTCKYGDIKCPSLNEWDWIGRGFQTRDARIERLRTDRGVANGDRGGMVAAAVSDDDTIYEGVCPKCGTKLRAIRRKVVFRWPQKQWDKLWKAFDELFKAVKW